MCFASVLFLLHFLYTELFPAILFTHHNRCSGITGPYESVCWIQAPDTFLGGSRLGNPRNSKTGTREGIQKRQFSFYILSSIFNPTSIPYAKCNGLLCFKTASLLLLKFWVVFMTTTNNLSKNHKYKISDQLTDSAAWN